MFEFFKKGTTDEEKEALRDAAEKALEEHQEYLGEAPTVAEEYARSQKVEDQDLNIMMQSMQEEKSLSKNPELIQKYFSRLENRKNALLDQLGDTLDLLRTGHYTGESLRFADLSDRRDSLKKEADKLAHELMMYRELYEEGDVQRLDTQQALAQYDLLLKTLSSIESELEKIQIPLTQDDEIRLQEKVALLTKEQQELSKAATAPNFETPGFDEPIGLN